MALRVPPELEDADDAEEAEEAQEDEVGLQVPDEEVDVEGEDGGQVHEVEEGEEVGDGLGQPVRLRLPVLCVGVVWVHVGGVRMDGCTFLDIWQLKEGRTR